jgi:arylsulfatase A-like enzyme
MAAGAWLPGCDSKAPLCAGCNVVLISMDTLRADHLGAYGYARPTSPNIDRLAARSVVFEKAVAQSAWTRPAHASMFSGRYPSEHGIVGINGEPAIPEGLPLLAERLAEAGYRTEGLVGGGNVDARFGFGRGFGRYRSRGRRFEDHLEAAEAVVRESDPRPFFLFVHGFDAHKPYKSTPEDRAALGLERPRARGMEKLCAAGAEPSELAPFVADYDAAIRRGDRHLGKLFEATAVPGNGRPTVLVFTSDHGEEFGEHGGCWHIRTLYREVVEVPLIVAVPGLAPRRVPGPVAASVAVAPTILDIVGVAGGEGEGGIPREPSLLDELHGRSRPSRPVVSQTASRLRGDDGGELWAWTDTGKKLLHFADVPRQELFYLAQDPAELDPLRSGPGVSEQLERLEDWQARHRLVAQPRSLGRLPADLERRLKRLGYLEDGPGG